MTRATDPHDYTDARGRNLCDTCDKWQGFASHREAATLDRIAPDELRAVLERLIERIERGEFDYDTDLAIARAALVASPENER